jgi:hypothetical protein
MRIYPNGSSTAKRRVFTGPLEPTNEWYAIAKPVNLKQFESNLIRLRESNANKPIWYP